MTDGAWRAKNVIVASGERASNARVRRFLGLVLVFSAGAFAVSKSMEVLTPASPTLASPTPVSPTPASPAVAPTADAAPACIEGWSVTMTMWNDSQPSKTIASCKDGTPAYALLEHGTDPITISMTAASWDAMWKTLDAASWRELDTACMKEFGHEGKLGPSNLRGADKLALEITDGTVTKTFTCKTTRLLPRHIVLMDAMYEFRVAAFRAVAVPR